MWEDTAEPAACETAGDVIVGMVLVPSASSQVRRSCCSGWQVNSRATCM